MVMRLYVDSVDVVIVSAGVYTDIGTGDYVGVYRGDGGMNAYVGVADGGIVDGGVRVVWR